MHTKVCRIHNLDNNAQIGIMARPRGNDWLEDEITHLNKCGVNVLVSLLERSEIYEPELSNEQELCLANKISYINFPIRDRDVPGHNDNTDKLINLLAGKLSEGLSIVVHSRMGIGRSTLIAAAILLKFNLKVNDIIETVIKVRGVNVPDTELQLQWLKTSE